MRLMLTATAVLGFCSVGDASLTVRITEDPSAPGGTNASTQTFTTSTASGGFLTINATPTAFADFTIASLTATSNSPNTTATQDSITLTTGAVAAKSGISGTHTLEFDVIDTGFTNPLGPTHLLNGSASGTYIGSTSGSTLKYQSLGNTTAAPLLTNSLPAGNGVTPNSYSGNAAPGTFAGTDPFTLTAYNIFTTAHAGTLQITGSTTSTAVPEPSTVILVSFGAAWVAVQARRRSRPGRLNLLESRDGSETQVQS